jgi:hypothetical protein
MRHMDTPPMPARGCCCSPGGGLLSGAAGDSFRCGLRWDGLGDLRRASVLTSVGTATCCVELLPPSTTVTSVTAVMDTTSVGTQL